MYEAVKNTLKSVVDEDQKYNIQVPDDGHVIVLLEVDHDSGSDIEGLRQRVEKEVASLPEVSKLSVILTADKVESSSSDEGKKSRCSSYSPVKSPVQEEVAAKKIIAVASGKGGVGKSTVAANLAVGLAKNHGLKVGLLDADIYGPSQPMMMGDENYHPVLNSNKKLIPALRHGVKVMSIGFVADPSKAIAWRGPMAGNAFYQLIRDVDWSEDGEDLDVLVIDLPPGTGDIQLTMAQKIEITGAVIVSTPQDIALIDARRAVEIFDKMDIPVLGIIENMSTFVCSNCGHEDHIFGNGGAREEAENLGVGFLGDIPLSRKLRECSDNGKPIVADSCDDVCSGKIDVIVSNLGKIIL